MPPPDLLKICAWPTYLRMSGFGTVIMVTAIISLLFCFISLKRRAVYGGLRGTGSLLCFSRLPAPCPGLGDPAVGQNVAGGIHPVFSRQGVYYYPTMLPKDMLSEEVKTGEVDPKLWVALEDMHDGWEKSGEVGQEVYGAGNAFGILPRHYMQVAGQPFMIYTDYPTYGFSSKKHRPVNFKLAGDPRLSCRFMLVKTDKGKMPEFSVTQKGSKELLKGKKTKEGHLEFAVLGDSELHISWK